MGTFSNAGHCPKCIITIYWTMKDRYITAEILKAPKDNTPPQPPNCTIFPPQGGPFMISDPYWNIEQRNPISPIYLSSSYSLPYDCIAQARNVIQLGPTTSKTEERFKATNAPVVTFYYQCSAPNPNPPPPEILTITGPIQKTFERDLVDEITTFTSFFKGEIMCECGEPAECGCKGRLIK